MARLWLEMEMANKWEELLAACCEPLTDGPDRSLKNESE